MLPIPLAERLKGLQSRLAELLVSPIIRFDERCRRNLPDLPGVYRILPSSQPIETVRAGRADVTLRQRVYTNHLMGDQKGNLRAQLVRGGECAEADAKEYIRQNLAVQILTISDARERTWLEHFLLAVLQPRYSD
jgi:hypothetical protein